MNKNVRMHLISAAIMLVFGAINFYITLPAINIHAPGFLGYLVSLCVVYAVAYLVQSHFVGVQEVQVEGHKIKLSLTVKILIGIVLACALVWIVGSAWGAQIFNAGAYRDLLKVENGNFTEDVSEITYDNIPRLDAASAQMLGDRKMGELSDMVSQFAVMNNYTQINYKGRPVRVTPFEYADIFKWFSNVGDGISGYLMIDMVTQEAELIRLEEGMKYSPSEPLNRNI